MGFILLTTRSLTPQPQYASPMPYRPESVSILIRFQSQVPRTIMHLTSVILTFLRSAAARLSKGAASPRAAAVWKKLRRFMALSVLRFAVNDEVGDLVQALRAQAEWFKGLVCAIALHARHFARGVQAVDRRERDLLLMRILAGGLA